MRNSFLIMKAFGLSIDCSDYKGSDYPGSICPILISNLQNFMCNELKTLFFVSEFPANVGTNW